MRIIFPLPQGQLILDGEVVDVKESAHTGRAVRRVEADLTVPAAEARHIHTALQSPRLKDEQGTDWAGAIKTESYRDPQGLHNLQIELQELEQLQAEAVEFEGFTLVPSEYEERADEGGIAIDFRATLDASETERLRELQQSGPLYFPTTRRGVDDRPRSMRFGRVLWQPREDGGTDYKIVLVEEGQDRFPSAFGRALSGEPVVGHLMNAVEQLLGEREALLKTLRERDVLNEASIEQIGEAGAEAIGKKRYRFFEVNDLSDWN